MSFLQRHDDGLVSRFGLSDGLRNEGYTFADCSKSLRLTGGRDDFALNGACLLFCRREPTGDLRIDMSVNAVLGLA